MMPALVVPPVATTAITSSARGWASSVATSPVPVIRWSSHGTRRASTPSTRKAFPTEEWASSLMATSGRDGARSPMRCSAVSRATISADRFPADPPETKQPPAPEGSPARAARTSSAWFSAATAPAASIHDVPWREEHATTMSNSRDALVGAAGMNDRNRGLSHDTTAVASSWSKISMMRLALVPVGLISPSRLASRDSACAPPKSRGTGSSARRHRQ